MGQRCNQSRCHAAANAKDPEIVKLGKDDTAYSYNKRTGRMEMIAGNRNQANFEDTMKLRKEVADLPEVKRYSQAAPIFSP